MEHDNSIPSLIEKTIKSIYTDIADRSPPWERPTNAVEWWKEDETNGACGISSPTQEATEWNLDRFQERLGEASTALVWKEQDKPTVSPPDKKPTVTRLQDCFILDLGSDGVINDNDTNINDKGTLPNANITQEDPLESLSWPYDSLFFSGGRRDSPCIWKSRKRRIALPSSTTTADTTDEPTVTLDQSATFHDNLNQKPKLQVWSQDPMETSLSMHTRYVPSLPETTTPPPIRVRKRKKKGWNATNQPAVVDVNHTDQNSNDSPKLFLPVRKQSIDPSGNRQRSSTALPLKWLQYEPSNGENDDDDSSTESSMKPKRDNNQELLTNNNAVARFRQILLQKEPMTEADFITKPNRSLFHSLMYEQTMGVSMAALKEQQTRR
jgi:hypothetical protein